MGYVEKQRGRYRARYRDPLGRVTSTTFDRKADAQQFRSEMETEKARGNWIDPCHADLPLAQWSAEFLALARRLSPSTQETYRRDLNKYVLPTLGAYRLGALPPDEIENWLNIEMEAGIAASSVHRHFRTLRRVLQVAVDKQKILTNPCDRVEPPRVTEQLIRLATNEWLRKKPKTPASVRSITISSVTAELMSEHLSRFASAGPDGLAFPNAAGHSIAATSFWNNHFSRAQRASGVKCRFHDLRHSSVALAIIAEGAHPKAIQAKMGHSSINVTLDRYGRLFPELDQAIATSFALRLAGLSAHAGLLS